MSIAAPANPIMKGYENSGMRIGGAPLYTATAAPFPQVWISSRKALDTSSTLRELVIDKGILREELT